MTDQTFLVFNYFFLLIILWISILEVHSTYETCIFPSSELSALHSLYTSTNGDYWLWNSNDSLSNAISYFEKYLNSTYTVDFIIPLFESFDIYKDIRSYSTEHFGGNHWNFTGTQNPCIEDWKGINCDYYNISSNDAIYTVCTVVGVVLPNNNMTGTLPDNITLLSNLVELSLPINNLYGPIPSSLSQLSKLVYLDLSSNYLQESIPVSLLSTEVIEVLVLSSNILTGSLSQQLFMSPSLRYFHVEGNFLEGYLGDLFIESDTFTSIRSISLIDNAFYGPLPSTVCQYRNMTLLTLGYNYVYDTLPKCLTELTNLVVLDVGYNLLRGPIDTEIFTNMKSLSVLILQFNSITGSLSPELFWYNSSFLNLRLFLMGSNLLTGTIPSAMSRMTQLRNFDLSINPFLKGTLPSELYNMTNLLIFNLFDTGVGGSISPSISKLQYLAVLSITSTSMTGPIPSELGMLNNLTFVFLADNYFSQSIPESLGSLSYIRKMYLTGNFLTGSVPIGLFNYSFVYEIGLQSNYLDYSFPSIIHGWKKLQLLSSSESGLYGSFDPLFLLESIVDIDLGGNQLSGTLSSDISALSTLQILDIDNNFISGTLPQTLGHLINLRQLIMYDNIFSGDISNFTMYTPYLEVLLIQFNEFNGHMDNLIESLCQCSSLLYLDMSHNLLSGTIPSNIGKLTSLEEIHLGINCFHGSIPSSICNQKNLSSFSLNGLTSACKSYFISPKFDNLLFTTYFSIYMDGSLPTCLWSLSNLTTLKAAGNGLTGTIPTDVSNRTLLNNISISYNRFGGTIPEWLQQTSFTYLDLSHNSFKGNITSFDDNLHLQSNEQENVTIYLNVNRLSGAIPNSFENINNINVLLGNIFDCNSVFPRYDPDKNAYICGSSIFVNSIITFCSVIGFLLLIHVLIYWRRYLLYWKLLFSENAHQNQSSDSIIMDNENRSIGKCYSDNTQSSAVRIDHDSLNSGQTAMSSAGPDDTLKVSSSYPKYPQSMLQVHDFHNERSVSSTARSNDLYSVLVSKSSSLIETIVTDYNDVIRYRHSFQSYIETHPNDELSIYMNSLYRFIKDIVYVTIFILFFGFIVYPLLKLNYKTYEYQYGWIVTSAYLQGDVPVYIILILYVILILVITRQLVLSKLISKSQSNDNSTENERFHLDSDLLMSIRLSSMLPSWLNRADSQADSTKPSDAISALHHNKDKEMDTSRNDYHQDYSPSESIQNYNLNNINNDKNQLNIKDSGDISIRWNHFKRKLRTYYRRIVLSKVYYKSKVFLLYTIAVIFNIVIVTTVNILYAIAYISSSKATVIDAARFLLSLFQVVWGLFVLPNIFSYVSEEGPYCPQRQSLYVTIVYIFNTVVIPCLTATITLEDCFKGLFISANTISSTYTWYVDSIVVIVGHEVPIPRQTTQTTSFSPPFVYSGQCSSGILDEYIPVFIISYIIQITLVPIIYGFLCRTKLSYYPTWIQSFLPPILWPEARQLLVGFPLKLSYVTAMVLLDLTVMISFGAVCPPLAAVVCIAIICKITSKEVLIGRYIYHNLYLDMEKKPINVSRAVSKRIAQAIYHPLTRNNQNSISPSLAILNYTDTVISSSFAPNESAVGTDNTPSILFPSMSNPSYLPSSIDSDSSVVTNSKRKRKHYLKFEPIESLQMAARGMWRCPTRCLSVIYVMTMPLFVLTGIDISNDIYDLDNNGGLVFMIVILVAIVPILMYFMAKYPHVMGINIKSNITIEHPNASINQSFDSTDCEGKQSDFKKSFEIERSLDSRLDGINPGTNSLRSSGIMMINKIMNPMQTSDDANR